MSIKTEPYNPIDKDIQDEFNNGTASIARCSLCMEPLTIYFLRSSGRWFFGCTPCAAINAELTLKNPVSIGEINKA